MTDPVQLLIDAGAIPSTPFGPSSRYNGVPLALLQRRPDQPGQVHVKRRFIPAPNSIAIAARHVVAAQERPDLLGAKYLGDPLLYWRIADANAVVDPNELTDTLGRRVAIPLPPGM
ncbi:Base plate wedge protein 53 [Piscinibacter sp.]|jgi:hypothetical protein|uniref:Base plate wedge protein 53 n=1 Tax=Piscinibacter sp. TaxID=1903157 RepID=UPI00355A2328